MTVDTFETDDIDEASATIGRVFHDLRLTQTRNAPLGFTLRTGAVGSLQAGLLRYGTEVTSASIGTRYFVAIPLKGTLRFDFGRVAVAADSSTAAIGTADRPARVRGWSSGEETLFCLNLDPDILENHLRRLVGSDTTSRLHLSPSLDLRSDRGAQWSHLVQSIGFALQSSDGLATHPMVSAELSSAVMTGLLLAADHPHREALDAWTKPVPPPALRRALDLIDERAHEPLTVVDIADYVGYSVRALQLSFKKHLETTPREYIRRVRMDRAHTMLRLATPDTASVADIAAMFGFNQPGRFAAEYRKIYGVPPRTTLRNH